MTYNCKDKLHEILNNKINNNTEIQLQISLSSTNDTVRSQNVRRKLMKLHEIRDAGDKLFDSSICFNKKYKYITLSFTIYEESEFDHSVISSLFDPKKFCIRIRDASPSEKMAQIYTRLTDEKFRLYQEQIEEAGFNFFDGRSEALAVKNNLTMGLNKLHSVLS